MAYRIQIAKSAEDDAREYALFIRDHHSSPEAANKWLAELFGEISALREYPLAFPVIRESEELGFPYRSFNYHSHRVVYAVHGNDLVVIHRVYHGARQPLRAEDLDPR